MQMQPWAASGDQPIDILNRDVFHGRLRMAGLALLVLSAIAFAAAILPDAGDRGAAVRNDARMPAKASAAQLPTSQAPAFALRPAALAAGWMPVRKPISMFNLEGPETEGAEFTQLVFSQGSAARRDILSWRADAESTRRMTRPLIRIVVERLERSVPTQSFPTHGMMTHKPLFADMAMRGAEADIVIERMNPVQELATKFGTFEVADAMLATDRGVLACLLYRRIDTLGLTIAGWYCGSAKNPADRVSLGCFINRLDLMSAGQDKALRDLFATAERNRKGCAGARQSGRKLTWLDHEAPLPALKLSMKARR